MPVEIAEGKQTPRAFLSLSLSLLLYTEFTSSTTTPQLSNSVSVVGLPHQACFGLCVYCQRHPLKRKASWAFFKSNFFVGWRRPRAHARARARTRVPQRLGVGETLDWFSFFRLP